MAIFNDKELEELRSIGGRAYADQLNEYQNNYLPEIFPGKHPVRVLKNNLLERYNHFSESAEQQLSKIQEIKLNDKIKWDVYADETTFPNCSFDANGESQIHVSENYFAYLWCSTYCFLLLYEDIAQRNPLDKGPEELIITPRMIERAKQLFLWSRTMDKSSRIWEISEPSPFPTSKLVDSEAAYCLLANNLSINGLTFVLYHELGHAVFGEILDEQNRKRIEQDADNFAMDLMREPKGIVTQTGAGLGVLMALCSNLFLLKPPLKLSSTTHPDPDLRIVYAMERLTGQDPEARNHYAWFVATIFRMFSQMYLIESSEVLNTPKDFNTMDEVIEYFIKLFEAYK